MNTDFAKLLNNCLNRVDGKDDESIETKTSDDDSGMFSENVETSSSNSNSPVRSEIKDIIEEKIKRKDNDPGSPVLEKVEPIYIGAHALDEEKKEASQEEAPEKAKILFSLKDFFERSKELSANNVENSSGDGEESDGDDSSDLDKNVESLYNDGKDPSQDRDSENDIISDEEGSDLYETEQSVDNFMAKSDSKSDNESDVEDSKGDEPDQNSDLESELNILEKLKQKLDDSIIGTPNDQDKSVVNELNKESPKTMEKGTNGGGNKLSDDGNGIDETEKGKGDKESHPEKDKLCDGSNSAPINIDDDTSTKDTSDQTANPKKEAKSMFKNISISVVGGNSRNINLESFLTKKPPNTAAVPKPTFSGFPTNPNISLKRKTVKSHDTIFDSKRFKKSSILLSSDEDSPRKNSIPTVTLDENSTVEEISDGEEDTKPKKTLADQYDNCTHGDPMDYMCVDCTYNRWRCEWEFVKPRKVKKIKMAATVQVNPVEIIQAVNWEKVFKFAGVGVQEKSNNE